MQNVAGRSPATWYELPGRTGGKKTTVTGGGGGGGEVEDSLPKGWLKEAGRVSSVHLWMGSKTESQDEEKQSQ